MSTNYGFVRSTDTWGVNSVPWQRLKDAGFGGLLFSTDDPHLEQALTNARSQGLKAGIWVPAGAEAGADAKAYADRLVNLASKYGPDILVPDLEYPNIRGYKGSPGWQWHQDVINALGDRLKGTPLALSIMGNTNDLNLMPWVSKGAQIWAQSYGADPGKDQPYSVDYVRKVLTDMGVPADLINVSISPGQNVPTNEGPYSLYTVDDLTPDQWNWLSGVGHATSASPPAGGGQPKPAPFPVCERVERLIAKGQPA